MRAPATRGKSVARGLVQRRHPKIGNLDLTLGAHEDVFRLEVPVTNLEGVAIRDCAHKLTEEARGINFGKGPICRDVLIQIAVINIL